MRQVDDSKKATKKMRVKRGSRLALREGEGAPLAAH